MSGISYQHLITTTQTGDLILYCDHVPSTRQAVYSLVVMVIRDPTYLNQYLTGTFVISSTSNTDLGLYGCRLIKLELVLNYLERLPGRIYYRELRCPRDDLWQELLTKSVVSVTYFPRHCLDEVEWIVQQFYHPDSIYINTPNITQTSSHVIAYLYIRLGLLPTGIPWTVLSPGYFSYDSGYQLPFTNCNLLPERIVDFCVT
jgi:hypothetical protein